MSMSISYEATGRTTQKARTRAALIDAARRLLAAGRTPSVEDAAEAAAVSRATAYRYFPNRRALLVAAHPEVEATDLLGEDAPQDARERLDRTITELIGLTVDTEPQLRTMLRLSLEPGPPSRAAATPGPRDRVDREGAGPAPGAARPGGAAPPRHRHPGGVRYRGAGLADRRRGTNPPGGVRADAVVGARAPAHSSRGSRRAHRTAVTRRGRRASSSLPADDSSAAQRQKRVLAVSRLGCAACAADAWSAAGDDEQEQEPRPVVLQRERAGDAQQQDEDVGPQARTLLDVGRVQWPGLQIAEDRISARFATTLNAL